MSVMRPRFAALTLLLLPPLLASCGDSTSPPIPFLLTLSPGTLTMDALGLTQQYTVRVEDDRGNAIDGLLVTWSSSDPQVASVTSSGLVTGVGRGSTTITAAVEGLTDRGTLNVNPLPAQISKSAGDGQTGALKQALPLMIEVEVKDSQGNPLAGQTVYFTVVAGAGTVSPGANNTDAQGKASVTWTLGCSEDPLQRVNAGAGSLTVEFTATPDLSLPAICQSTVSDGRVSLAYSSQIQVAGGN